jgi:hypothetical protein
MAQLALFLQSFVQYMGSKKIWFNLSIVNLCLVAVLGVLMRSKIIFNIPWIDYNRLVDTHGHFAFAGWVTLALLSLFVYEMPGELYNKKIYRVLLGSVLICSWATLATSPFEKLKFISEYVSIGYILVTYVFSWVFIKDILKTKAHRIIKLLSVSSLLSLVLSSVGVLMLAYLFAVKSLNAMLYRDALFGYLHLQYNGFFTLAVFALVFNKVVPVTNEKAIRNIYRFAIMLCLSVLPSICLTFLWHETNMWVRIIAIIGGGLLLFSFIEFIISARLMAKEFHRVLPAIRFLVILSMSAFMIKIFLQSLTVIDFLNILVFGDRPMVMFFLHLVFLGFVTLFLIAYFAQKGILNTQSIFTRFALIVFAIAVVINETLLALQGLGNMLIASSPLFSWYLWGAGLLLLLGTLLVATSRIMSKQS